MSILTWLAACKRKKNINGISNGMAKLFLPCFLSGTARVAHESALQLDLFCDSSVRIKRWLEAIQEHKSCYAAT